MCRPFQGKGTGEINLFRKMYASLKAGDVVLCDALFDNYFIVCELRDHGIEIVSSAQHERKSTQVTKRLGRGDVVIVWPRPTKPRGMTLEQYKRYPEQLEMRQV